MAHPGDELQAPGVLANPVLVEALYDREVAREVVFRNLLQREGYSSLDAVREEGKAEGEVGGLRTALAEVLSARGLAVDDELLANLAGARDPDLLRRLLARAATAGSSGEVLAVLRDSPPAGERRRRDGM